MTVTDIATADIRSTGSHKRRIAPGDTSSERIASWRAPLRDL
jgi:hypothetical protein